MTTTTECRAQNPLTCRVHGADLAKALLLPGTTTRDFGLAAPALAKYAAETAALRSQLSDDEQDGISYYTGIGYSYVNGWLRNGLEGVIDAEIHDNYHHVNSPANRNAARKDISDRTLARIKRVVQWVDSAFTKAAVYDQPHVLYKAYRVRSDLNPNLTTAGEINDFVAKNYPVGKIFHNKAYTSTSIDPDYMLVHARRRPTQVIVHEIVTDKGLPLHEQSQGSIQSAEREMLLPRDIKLQVVGVTRATFEHSGLGPDMSHWGKPVPKQKRFVVVQFREVV